MKDPQKEEFFEPNSLGSDCCNDSVNEIDGVIICLGCNEPCEEVFETEEKAQERYEDEQASFESDMAQDRYERERCEE